MKAVVGRMQICHMENGGGGTTGRRPGFFQRAGNFLRRLTGRQAATGQQLGGR